MKYFGMLIVAIFCAGCMFVSQSYSPENNGYRLEGSCVGLNWDDCRARAEALCADVGQKVLSIERAGGPENDPGIAIVPKKIRIQCSAK